MRAPADADLLPDQDLLVARSRDLDRNNGVAAGAFQTLQDNAVGIGLRLSSMPDYRALGKTLDWAEAWTRGVESLWRTWADTCACDAGRQDEFRVHDAAGVSLGAAEWRVARAAVVASDATRRRFNTCIQLVETDRLSNPRFAFPRSRCAAASRWISTASRRPTTSAPSATRSG